MNDGFSQESYLRAQGSQNSPDSSFQKEVSSRYNTYAEVTFWIAIAELLLSFGVVASSFVVEVGLVFAGFIFSNVSVAVNLAFAAKGLNSQKGGKAIAATIMGSTSLFILFCMIIYYLTYRTFF